MSSDNRNCFFNFDWILNSLRLNAAAEIDGVWMQRLDCLIQIISIQSACQNKRPLDCNIADQLPVKRPTAAKPLIKQNQISWRIQ